MKDHGSLKHFLGIKLLDVQKVCSYVNEYISLILFLSGLLGVKPYNFPIEKIHKVSLATSALYDVSPLQEKSLPDVSLVLL